MTDADRQGSALEWSQARSREALPRRFGVIGLARDTLHCEAPELARDVDHVVIDGPVRAHLSRDDEDPNAWSLHGIRALRPAERG